jgi:hypothetical protein
MSSFYSTQFDRLFSASGNDKIAYYTDMIYGYKDYDTGFKDMVNLPAFLSSVSEMSINRVSKDSVDNVIDGKSSSLVVDNQSWLNGDKDTLLLQYSTSSTNSTISLDTAERIYNDFVSALGNPDDARVKAQLAEIPANHRKAFSFMQNIILAICNWKFQNVRNQMALAIKNSSTMIDGVKAAGEEIRIMEKVKETSVVSTLHNTCSKALAAMVKNQAPSTYLLSGFVEGPSFKDNRFRTTLREAMYSKLILREYSGVATITDDILMYIRRLLVDAYIVAYYPYIHFQYINELLNKFKASGNFVNMRVAALVRVAFTINMLMSFHEQTSTIFNTDQQKKGTNIITQWAETLKNYMTALSRVDFANKDATIPSVIADLHTLSSKVSTQSMNVDELKDNISTTQLQIRSILARFKQINGDRSSKVTQYSLLVFVLLLVIVVSAVMIVFNFYKDYLLYALIGLCVLVAVIKLGFSIVALVKMQTDKAK